MNETTPTPTPTGVTPEFTPELTQEQFYAQLEQFDPIKDLAGPWTGDVNSDQPFPETTLAAFSPDTVNDLKARAAEINRSNPDAAVGQAIAEHLRGAQIAIRVKAGTGENSSEYATECASLEYEVLEAEKESMQIATQLNAKRTVLDRETGKQIETGDFVITGDKRAGLENRIAELWRRSVAVTGAEGDRRMLEAKQRDYAVYCEREQLRTEAAEVNRRAAFMASEKRINDLATIKARHISERG